MCMVVSVLLCLSWERLALCSFFFNDPATTEIYTLSLHDALPISGPQSHGESSSGKTKQRFTSDTSRLPITVEAR